VAQHEGIPPPGFLMVDELPVHGDDPFPRELFAMVLYGSQYPTLARALNLVRADNGGPTWQAQDDTIIPEYWEPWLLRMEVAMSALRDDLSAPEDTEAPKTACSLYDSELYTFICGEEDIMVVMCARSPELQAVNNFLNDFFDGWALKNCMMHAGDFRPDLAIQEE
jgi:hypothetical protein